MTDITAAAQLQAWLDGATSTLSKTAVRTVLWDLAEAQARLEQLGCTEVEWTVASHWRHSVEYGEPVTEEQARAYVREEHSGAQLSIASRVAGEWRHEDPRAQAHRDQVAAAALVIAPVESAASRKPGA